MNAITVAFILAGLSFVLWLIAQLFDNLALNVRSLDDRLARIHTASFFAEASRVVLTIGVVCALIGAFT